MRKQQYNQDTIDSLVENALSGGIHSQSTLAEYYAAGYQVRKCVVTAYAWAFVASNNGSEIGALWKTRLWKEFKTESERRNALVKANDLWIKILGTSKRG